MIALYVIAGIAALIFALLMVNLGLFVTYERGRTDGGESSVKVAAGPVRIKLHPKKEKKIRLKDYSPDKFRRLMDEEKGKKPSSASNEKKDQKKEKNPALPSGIGEIYELVSELVAKFETTLVCEIKEISLDVGTDSASSTALLYAGTVSGVEFLIEFLRMRTVLKYDPKNVRVAPDFEGGTVRGRISLRLKIRVIDLLRAGSGFIRRYFRTLAKSEKIGGGSGQNHKRTVKQK